MKLTDFILICILTVLCLFTFTMDRHMKKITEILNDNSIMLSELTIGERPFTCETVPCIYPEAKFWESRKQLTKEKKK